jgi:sulfocyanin
MLDQTVAKLPLLRRLLVAALLALLPLMLEPAPSARAEEGAAAGKAPVPSWMQVDAAAEKVTLDMVSGWNGNNGALNYNGYHDGDVTVVIPAGWTVEVKFRNNDSSLPHSILVTKPYAKNEFPEIAGRDRVAVARAYSRSPEAGIGGGQTDDFRFKADPAGKYYFLCGVPGHAMAGMWVHLDISPEAKEPGVIIAPGAQSGRT